MSEQRAILKAHVKPVVCEMLVKNDTAFHALALSLVHFLFNNFNPVHYVYCGFAAYLRHAI